MLSPAQSFILTILFNIVIGIIIPTPGRHLKGPEKVHHHWFQQIEQLRNSPGSLWGCWTEDHVKWHGVFGLQCIEHPVSTQRSTQDKSHHRYSPWKTETSECDSTDAGDNFWITFAYPWVLQFVYNVITCEGYEPWQHKTHKRDKSSAIHEIIIMIQQSRTPCRTYQLYVQQIHRAVLMNLHQSGSSQWLQTH